MVNVYYVKGGLIIMDEEKFYVYVRMLSRMPKELIELLERIIQYEEEHLRPDLMKYFNKDAIWEWYNVRAEPKTLNKLVRMGIIDIVRQNARGRTDYSLTDREALKKAIETLNERSEKVINEDYDIPENVFDIIEGYDDLKELIVMALKNDEPVHFLLYGPPATAKSLFAMEIAKLDGAFMTTAGTSTKAGMRELIVSHRPRILIIDELDKISSSDDISVLLTLMESQKVYITMYGYHDEVDVKTWVFAMANRINKLSPELLDRFQKFHLKPYSATELEKVCIGALKKFVKLSEDTAKDVFNECKKLPDMSVRTVMRVGQLAKNNPEKIKKIVEVFAKYS